jgi:hypothetical protein
MKAISITSAIIRLFMAATLGFILYIFGMAFVVGMGFGSTSVLQRLGYMNHKVGDESWQIILDFSMGIAAIGLMITIIKKLKPFEIVVLRIVIIVLRSTVRELGHFRRWISK